WHPGDPATARDPGNPGSAPARVADLRGAAAGGAVGEGVAVPLQVVRQPGAQAEAGLAGGAVAPGRGDLADAAAGGVGLGGDLQRVGEAALALDREVEQDP